MLAEADSTAFTDPVTWVNFGVLGLIVLGLLTGWLWAKPAVDRLEKEKDRAIAEREKADAQRDAMAQVLQDRLIPVVGDFISTTKALLPVQQDNHQLHALLPLLQELVRQQGEPRDWSPSRPPAPGRRGNIDRPRD